jgi:integrase
MLYRWAVEMEYVPAATLIAAVKSLQQGRTAARETGDVAPVESAIVEATLPHLPAIIADMVRFQLRTGARPGEVCAMRVRDPDMTGDVWVYRPTRHKTAWRGHKRSIAIGPRAQEILRKYLRPQLDAFVFSPAEADRQRKELIRKNRKTSRTACETAPGLASIYDANLSRCRQAMWP